MRPARKAPRAVPAGDPVVVLHNGRRVVVRLATERASWGRRRNVATVIHELAERRVPIGAVMAGFPETCLLIEPDGTIVAINDEGAARFGLDAARMTGTNIYDHMPTEVAGIRQAHGREAVHRRQPVNFIDERDGLITQSLVQPVLDPDGEVAYLTVLGIDITERRRAEAAAIRHEERLRLGLEQSIRAIASTVEARDPYTAGHSHRVGELAIAIATAMGLPEEQVRGLRLAAAVHDLGKMHVPLEILAKPGRLTAVELRMIRGHAEAGYDILKDVDFPWPIALIVLQHHERMDGSGYPRGIAGESILLESRILAVADVVDAMSSHRPYRPALPLDAAIAEIARGSGTIYDREVAAIALRLLRHGEFAMS